MEIQENDAPGTVQFEAATVSVVEGGVATIKVTRAGGAAGPITVGFATSGGTAIGGATPGPGVDYITRSGTLTFAAGATSQTFTIQTVADTLAEGAKTVNLALSIPAGSTAVLGAPGTAVLTIVDDEQPRLQFAIATSTVSEGAGAATLTVMRVGPTTGTHTVNYALAGVTATAGADFNAAGGTLTFGPGVASRAIIVPVVTDTINETAETFTVTLSAASAGAALGTPTVATVTITDDDSVGTVQFAASSFSVVEGGNVTLTATRTGGTAGPVTVAYSATPGTALISDFMTSSGVLTFAAGETTRTFTTAWRSATRWWRATSSSTSCWGPPPAGWPSVRPHGHGSGSSTRSSRCSSAPRATRWSRVATATITVTRVGVPAGTASATVVLGGTAVAGTDYVMPPSLVADLSPWSRDPDAHDPDAAGHAGGGRRDRSRSG